MPGPAISLGGDDGGDDGDNNGGDDGTGDDTEDPSTSSVFDIVTSTSSAGSSQTSAAEEATTSEAAEVTSTSSRRRPVRTSSTPAATPTSAPGNNNGSKPFTRQNGLDAIALNEKFKGIKASDPCQDGDMGCVGDSFAQCVGGKWLLTQCSAPTICAALPLVNKPGTSIACTTAEDRDSRIALTGALRMIKRHRRNLVPHVVGSF
ncbi:hypothetical protein FRC03_005063 [Tulasnella sp. 419]|nr:hypothetical protein FRC03_005063 [Tulasnella sp. 419]